MTSQRMRAEHGPIPTPQRLGFLTLRSRLDRIQRPLHFQPLHRIQNLRSSVPLRTTRILLAIQRPAVIDAHEAPVAQLMDIAEISGSATFHESRHLGGGVVPQRFDSNRRPRCFHGGVKPPVAGCDLERKHLALPIDEFEARRLAPGPPGESEAVLRSHYLHDFAEELIRCGRWSGSPPGMKIMGVAVVQIVGQGHAATQHDVSRCWMACQKVQHLSGVHGEVRRGKGLGRRHGSSPFSTAVPSIAAVSVSCDSVSARANPATNRADAGSMATIEKSAN